MRILLTRLKQHARALAFVTLVVVTAYGLYRLFFGATDWKEIITHWQAMGFWLLVVLVLAVADYALEAICWMWLYSRFHMHVWDGAGFSVYLSGHAGVLVPAQMGRLVRPHAITRLGRGNFTDGVLAEAALLFLDVAAALITISTLAFFWIQPLAAPVVALGLSVSVLFFADRITPLFSGTRISFPQNFWRGWQPFAILWLLVVGWLLSGLGLYALVWNLAEGISAVESIFFASLSRLLGSGTGLPGGIGVIEGLLGLSLGIMGIPEEHIIVAVSAYRLLTFWLVLPVGWIALLFVNHRVARMHRA